MRTRACPRTLGSNDRRRAAGFTLVELAVVAAVIAILVGLTLSALQGFKNKANFATVSAQLVADLANARQRAPAEQVPVTAMFGHSSSNSTANPDRYLVFVNRSNMTVTTVNPAAIAPADMMVDRLLPSSTAFGMGTETTYLFGDPGTGNRLALPAPFNSVIAGGPCTFGRNNLAAPYDMRGAVTFMPDGSVVLSNGALTGSVALHDRTDPKRRAIVAIVGATGAVRMFQP